MAVTLKRCSKCNCMFDDEENTGLCSKCTISKATEGKDVRGFVRANPGVTVKQVSEALDVPETVVISMVRDGMLDIVELNPSSYPCGNCDARILAGRYCSACSIEIGKDITNKEGPTGKFNKNNTSYILRTDKI